MPPKPLPEDPDDLPAKAAPDEIEAKLSADPSYSAPPPPVSITIETQPAAQPVAFDPNSDAFKYKIEELRFHLEERKELHRIEIEIRKQTQEEIQAQWERDKQDESDRKKDEKQSEHWMQKFWRPAMGWLYMCICAFDFIVGPILAMAMPLFLKQLGAQTVTYTQWQSLTLANGGLIHLAFGAILGVTAWTRGQEKMAKIQQQ
jgi:Holin of 3TMs, for gene-transfer release